MMKKLLLALVYACVVLLCFSSTAIADLILAEGKPTGQWYNPDRDGEGFFVEVINSAGIIQISVAMYSYDTEGSQLWLVGTVPIDEDDTVASVPVYQVDGPVWGSGYDPDDRNIIEFGTLTVRFTSCGTALFQIRNDVGLEDGDYPLVRLTNIVGIECTDTQSPPSDGVTPGKWVAEGVCLFVSEDGRHLTSENSTCPNGAPMWLGITGTEIDVNAPGGSCLLETSCLSDISIIEETGYFACLNPTGGVIEGWFTSEISAYGNAVLVTGASHEVGRICSAEWTAAPE